MRKAEVLDRHDSSIHVLKVDPRKLPILSVIFSCAQIWLNLSGN